MKRFVIINGPNLNMLGTRETSIYGDLTLDEIIKQTESRLGPKSVKLEWYQYNTEGEIVERIHACCKNPPDALIINPAAYSHTSISILDALKMLSIPIVEVHLSNTHLRESFRQKKVTAAASTIVMEGLGQHAYYFAVLSQMV